MICEDVKWEIVYDRNWLLKNDARRRYDKNYIIYSQLKNSRTNTSSIIKSSLCTQDKNPENPLFRLEITFDNDILKASMPQYIAMFNFFYKFIQSVERSIRLSYFSYKFTLNPLDFRIIKSSCIFLQSRNLSQFFKREIIFVVFRNLLKLGCYID